MADKDIIKEFLVKLGFQKDEKSLREFNKGIEDATAKARVLGLAIVGISAAAATAAIAFAKNMERMYFASKQSGASVNNLKAFENAVQNITGAGDEAVTTIEQLAQWMRYTPGSGGILASLGVQSRDAKGNLRDTADILADLAVQLRSMDPFVSKAYADQLKIPEGVYRAMMSGEFDAQLARQQQIVKDSGFDEAADDAHEFMTALRELSQEIQVAFLPIMKELVKEMGPNFKAASQWMIDHQDGIKDFFNGIAVSIKVVYNLLHATTNLFKRAGRWIYDLLPSGVADKIGEVVSKLVDGEKKLSQNKTTRGSGDVMSTLRGYGWSKEQAAGIMANLMSESKMDPSAVGDNGKAYGIAQWHPDRQAAFRKWSGKDIKNSTLDEQLGFLNYELTRGSEKKAGDLLRATTNARQAGEVVSRHYERPLNSNIEATLRGNRAVQIAQETNIYVNGGDAAATGRAVSNEQQQVNASMARNFSTALK